MSQVIASSFIRKSSGKKFAPKAPVRRGGPGQVTASSLRPSVDRQTASQTPQPPSRVTTSAAPSAPSPPPEQLGLHPQAKPPPPDHDLDRVTPIPTPASGSEPGSAIAQLPREPLLGQHDEVPDTTATTSAPPPGNDRSNVTPDTPKIQPVSSGARYTSETGNETSLRGEDAATSNPLPTSPPLPQASEPSASEAPPASKRRKTATSKVTKAGPQAHVGQPATNDTVSNAQVVDDGALDAHASSVQSSQKGTKRKRNAQKTADTSAVDIPGATIAAEESRTKKKRAKPRTRKEQIGDVAAPVDTAAVVEGEPVKKRSGRKRKKGPGTDNETEIAPTAVTMSDLCRGSRVGEKSEMETKLQEKSVANEAEKKKRKEEVEKQRQERAQQPSSEVFDEAAQTMPTIREEPEIPPEEPQSQVGAVPETRVVNGQIVLMGNSTTIDRGAEARAAAAEQEAIDETGKLERLTSSTHAKWAARKTKNWDDEDIELFYRGLRTFGTDFQMVSRLFLADSYDPEGKSGRTRRQIKARFTLEERRHPERIKEALLGPREVVDMAQVSTMTGTVYQDAAQVWQAVHEEAQEENDRREAAHSALIGTAEEAQNDENAAPEAEVATANAISEENPYMATAREIVAAAVNPRKKGKKVAVPKKKPVRRKPTRAPAGAEEVLGSIEDLQR